MLLLLTCFFASLMRQTNAQALGGLPPGSSGVGVGEDDDVATDYEDYFVTASFAGDGGTPRTKTPPSVGELPPLAQPEHEPVGNFSRQCDCVTPRLTSTQEIFTADIRRISNEFCRGGDAGKNAHGLSNMGKRILPTCERLCEVLFLE